MRKIQILEHMSLDGVIEAALLGTGKRFFSEGIQPRELALSTKAVSSSSAPTDPTVLCGPAPRASEARSEIKGGEEQ